ncbi:MAG: hypothetical protein CMJ48_04495 [Planctomycetaceae bacterium]|nr:hypothetical protein [Planctomycetaceae bacterium]
MLFGIARHSLNGGFLTRRTNFENGISVGDLLTNLSLDELVESARRVLPQTVMTVLVARFHMFVLVLIRLSGLMVIGPVFGQSSVPPNIRVLLVLVMAFLVTPVLDDHSQIAFNRLDADADGFLLREEVPDRLLERYESLLRESGRSGQIGLTHSEFYFPLRLPKTMIDLTITIANEFALGLVLGLGVMTVISGLQLGGQLIDQQTGLALGNVFNPGVDISGTLTGKTYYLLGITAFLVMEPMGGHLLMMRSLLETFQALPVGEASISVVSVDLLRDLVHQSMVIALLLAAPMLAVMSLVALAMGFLGHTVPQVNVLVVGFPVRSLVALTILVLTMSGTAELIVDQVPVVIDDLRYSITGLD